MSNHSQALTATGEGHSRYWTTLKRRIDNYEGILYKDEFTVGDFECDEGTAQGILITLKQSGAIEATGERRISPGNNPVSVWRWVAYQEELQEYAEQRDELSCGCRSHIPAETDDQGRYICKFCGAKHPREVIKNAL